MQGMIKNLLYFREGCQGTRVAPTDENPWSFLRRDVIPARHRELDVVREVLQVVNCLLDGMMLQTLDGEVVIRIRIAIVPVLDNDSCAVQLLCNQTVDRPVRQVAFVTYQAHPNIRISKGTRMSGVIYHRRSPLQV